MDNFFTPKKSKRKVSFRTFILLIFSLIMTTFAWFTYSKILEPTLKLHMASWDIEYYIEGKKQENMENGVLINIDTLFPGMNEQTVTIDIINNGEVYVDIELYLQSITILGIPYELVKEGDTPNSENYITFSNPVLETDETTGEKIYLGSIINDLTNFPFTIEIEHSAQVEPVLVGADGNEVPGQGYLKVIVNWVGDNDELDTEWGYKAGEFLANNPNTPSISVGLGVHSYQSDTSQASSDPTESYEILNGENLTYTGTDTETITVRASGEFAKFTGLEVDDVLVDEDNYTAISGSTIVTLKKSYLDTLANGEHKMTFLYTDGEISTYFKVAKVEIPDNPNTPDVPDEVPDNEPDTPNTPDVPVEVPDDEPDTPNTPDVPVEVPDDEPDTPNTPDVPVEVPDNEPDMPDAPDVPVEEPDNEPDMPNTPDAPVEIPDDEPSNIQTGKSPVTGDNIYIYIGLMIIAGIGIVIIIIKLIRKRKKSL